MRVKLVEPLSCWINYDATPLLIFSQSDYLIQIFVKNLHTWWQTVQIQISWLLQKPNDLDLHCLQKQGISGFSRTRVVPYNLPPVDFLLTVPRRFFCCSFPCLCVGCFICGVFLFVFFFFLFVFFFCLFVVFWGFFLSFFVTRLFFFRCFKKAVICDCGISWLSLHIITKTYLYNFDPLKPNFFIVKLGFTGVYSILLIFAQKHRLWVLVRIASSRRF